MKLAVIEAGIFKPTTAVIRAHTQRDYKIAATGLWDILIKTCILNNIKNIIVIAPIDDQKTSHLEHTNKKPNTVEHDASAAQLRPGQ